MSMTNRLAPIGNRSGWALLMVAALFCVERSRTAQNTTILTGTEAAILIYVSPVGDSVRARGFDIGIEQQNSAQLNQTDYYHFWVYNAKKQQPLGSVTIGYYAVNKHTGDVWDTAERQQLSSGLLLGVQRIVRESHQIDERKIQQYRDRPF